MLPLLGLDVPRGLRCNTPPRRRVSAGPRGPQLSSAWSHAHVQTQTKAKAKARLPSSRHTPDTAVLPRRALLAASSWGAPAAPPPRDHSPPPSRSPAPAGRPLLPPRPPPNAGSNTPGRRDGRSGRWSAPRGGRALSSPTTVHQPFLRGPSASSPATPPQGAGPSPAPRASVLPDWGLWRGTRGRPSGTRGRRAAP